MSTLVQEIDAFKERIRLCAQDYSTVSSAEKLERILSIDPQANCVLGLRAFIGHVKPTSKTKELVLYIKWYLDSVTYIKELQENFKTRILRLLEQSSGSKRKKSPPGDTNSKHLQTVADQLKKMMHRLSLLLDKEGPINMKLFSLESEDNSISGYPVHVQALSRLVPDSLHKLKFSAQLATDWLTVEAEKRMESQSKAVIASQPKVTLINQLSQIQYEIKVVEDEFEHVSEELQCLLEREERANAISSENQALEIKLSGLLDKRIDAEHELDDIKALLKTVGSNQAFREKLMQDMRAKRMRYYELESRIRILEYQRAITVEDLCVELEVKPSWIRSTNNLQDKCISLESSLEAKRLERQKLELALKPISDD